jgi:energy-coupling factor transporter ATP-binding protein EcfA2
MALITLKEVSWGLGGANLIERASFQIDKGDRICLLGRNGVGKSTLLKLLDGTITPDSGEIWRRAGHHHRHPRTGSAASDKGHYLRRHRYRFGPNGAGIERSSAPDRRSADRRQHPICRATGSPSDAIGRQQWLGIAAANRSRADQSGARPAPGVWHLVGGDEAAYPFLPRGGRCNPIFFFWTNPQTIWISKPLSGWKITFCGT